MSEVTALYEGISETTVRAAEVDFPFRVMTLYVFCVSKKQCYNQACCPVIVLSIRNNMSSLYR
jgi:hypothetical protein